MLLKPACQVGLDDPHRSDGRDRAYNILSALWGLPQLLALESLGLPIDLTGPAR